MTCSAAEKRQIFLTCKAIFIGPNSLLRKSKTIKKRITKHQAELNTSIPNFEINRVTGTVQALLKKQVFQSDIKAKMEFPDLFTPSPVNNAKGNVFEAEAGRSGAPILRRNYICSRKRQCEDAGSSSATVC
ncbi:uncharacterized protein EURHEDRAFT_206233 [Aspergillus ruber CBS 135680]|uniref:Uncharacterized protein n=1 Tax=Aspergillus ruber (strain CBS 135680) TaxID=1388766 RepID=A0A017SPX2_ASPRC|nr:uncharacterized protein EURHEDRAFT_206233 [Aspergillus ruber CBS 135680]EYE98320.1 hypothetical protein EURHEDRAFT_206233 [Aspergillus ruber CBS 135680]